MFRLALIALPLLAAPALAANKLPDRECDRAFVKIWQRDQDAGIKMLPKQACMMRTGSGPYVCYPGGCARAHVYVDLDADELRNAY